MARRRMTAFAILVLAMSSLRAYGTPPAAPAAARKIDRMIQIIRNNRPMRSGKTRLRRGSVKTFSLTEDDVNSYIQYWVQGDFNKRSRDVVFKSASVRFEQGHILEADAVLHVGANSANALAGQSNSLLMGLLAKRLGLSASVHLKAQLAAADGVGTLNLQEVKIEGLTVPNSLVNSALHLIGEKQRPPLDLSGPISLPNGIRQVSVFPGKILLVLKAI